MGFTYLFETAWRVTQGAHDEVLEKLQYPTSDRGTNLYHIMSDTEKIYNFL